MKSETDEEGEEMSETAIMSNTSEQRVQKSEYGQANVLGLEVQFSKMLGDVVVENYIKQLSDEDMKLITEYITQDLFDEIEDYSSGDLHAKKRIVKKNWKAYSDWGSKQEVKSVGTKIKDMFNERVQKELQTKIEEIVSSADYQEKIEKMAQEIVDYSIEGYKEDLKQSIREKMIGNVMSDTQYYGGSNLIDIIHQVVRTYIPSNY